MGHTFHQFKALFWKNWLYRVRQPILSLSEVLWPFTLFLILAAVRFQEPPTHQENCYLGARDLPSRGLYPFIQSLFCNAGSRCKNRSSTSQTKSSFRAFSLPHGQSSITATDMAFLKEIQELAQGISETTKKATALQKLWEDESKLLDPADSAVFMGMNLSETEEMISKVENFHSQPYLWDLLQVLPLLQKGGLFQEHGIHNLTKLLQAIQNSLVFLEDLAIMPSNPKFYEVMKIGLNVTIAVLKAWNGEGFQYNLSLWDIVWNSDVVETELESRFGFELIQIERISNYQIKLNKFPTEETLEQFVCSILTSTAEAKADKESNENGCIFPPWLEAKAYLVQSVDPIKLYTKIFHQWIVSNRPHTFVTGLGQSIVNLLSHYPGISETWTQLYTASKTILQNLNENPECNFPDDGCKLLNVTWFLNKLEAALPNLFQCPVMKKLFLLAGAVRNITLQNLYFIKEAFQNLETLARYTEREEPVNIDTETIFVGLKQIFMSDASYACTGDLRTLGKSLGLPQHLKDILAGFVCHQNYSNETSKLRNRIHLINISVQLLQSTLRGQYEVPVSITDEYLGWQAIDHQLTETSTTCYKTKKLLNNFQSAESVSFSSCQKEIIQSLFWDTLDELWFGLEKSLYWERLLTVVRRTCEIAHYVNEGGNFTRRQSDGSGTHVCSEEKLSLKAVINTYVAFLQNLSNFPFTSWTRIITSVTHLLKSEISPQEFEEMKTAFVLRFVKFIQESILSNSSISLHNQDLQFIVEMLLDNMILPINNLGRRMEAEEFPTDFQIFSELATSVLENFQRLATLRHHHQSNVFLQMKERLIMHESGHKQTQIWSIEALAANVAEEFESLTRTAVLDVLENQRLLEKSLQFFQHLLTDWPKPTIWNFDYINNLSEHFIKALHEIGLLSSHQAAAAFRTIDSVKNALFLLVTNTSSAPEMQTLEEIASNFHQQIHRVEGSPAALFIQTLSSLYQDVDQFLRLQSNDSFVRLLHQLSRKNSTPSLQLDTEDLSKTFEFLSNTVKLLQDLPQKSLCEKLGMLYNYVELQAQFLVQNGDQEMETVANTLNHQKQLFLSKETCAAAVQHLNPLSAIPIEKQLNNGSLDFYVSGISSVNHTISFLSELVGHQSNAPLLASETNGPFANNCTCAWFQMWLKELEKMSKFLKLDSNFFTDLHKALALLSGDLENITYTEMCNKTTAVSPQMKSAVYLLESVTEITGLIDFEAFGNLAATFKHVVNRTGSYSTEELQEQVQVVASITVELHELLSNANFSRDFWDTWTDVFIPASSKVEYQLHSFGKSILNILGLSWKEFQTGFAQLKTTTELLKNIPQEWDPLSCSEVLQNATKLMSDDVLNHQNISQRQLPLLLTSFLTVDNDTSHTQSCNSWVLIIMNLIDQYPYSHFENAKDILTFLSSLFSFSEPDRRLENIPEIFNLIVKIAKSPCGQNAKDEPLSNDCISLVIQYLKLMLPTFAEKDDLQIVDFILNLFNDIGGPMMTPIIQNLTNYSTYALDSNQTTSWEAIMDLSEFPELLQLFWPASTKLSKEIQTLLKNVSSEYVQNVSFPLHTVIFFKAIQSLQKYSVHLLREPFQHLIHYLAVNNLNVHNMTFHAVDDTSNIDVKLIRKALGLPRLDSQSNSLGVLAVEVLARHMIDLLQNLGSADEKLLLKQVSKISKSLRYILTNVGQHAEVPWLNVLASWFDSINNASYLWNSASVRKIMLLFQEMELTEVTQMLHFIPEVVSLLENIARKNITDALVEVYQFTLKQSEYMATLSKEELSREVNSLLELLDPTTDMPEESARALRCFVAVICWNTTTTNGDGPASKLCDLDMQRSSVYDVAPHIADQLKPTTLQEEWPCSSESFLKEVTYQMLCFLHQLEEWHPVIGKFFEIHQANNSVLSGLLGFLNKLSSYVLTPRTNLSNSTHCVLMRKKRTTLWLIEALNNMTSSDVTAAKILFEQLANLKGGQTTNRTTAELRIKGILANLKNVASWILGVKESENSLSSFLSAIRPLMALSPAGNQTYMMLRALLTLARNGSLIESLEVLRHDTERNIENLMPDFNVRHLLSVIDKEIQLINMVLRQDTVLALASVLRPLNASFQERTLRSFEDALELGKNWLKEYSNKNVSKLINALELLMADKKSSNERVQSIKDVINFLALFKNGTQEDDPISFITDFLNDQKLKSVQAVHLILQNSLLNVIDDLTTKEEELRSNDTDLNIIEFIDLFFNDTQYENNGKDITPSPSRKMELIKVLQILFPSSTEKDRNKIFFLLKDIHKDIIAEMSVFPKDKLLALLHLGQMDNLNEETNKTTQNITNSNLGDYIYAFLKEAVLSMDGMNHFDRSKGLLFARDFLKMLLRNSAVNAIARRHENLLALANHILHSANNSWDSIPWTENLTSTLRFMKQISAEIEKFMGNLAKNSFPPRGSDLTNLTEFLNSINNAFQLKNGNILITVQRLLHVLFWIHRENYTSWSFSVIHDILQSLTEENDDSGQVVKIVEALFSFLTLSRKVSRQLVAILEAPLSSDTIEKLSSLEMAYLAVEEAVHKAIQETKVQDSNVGQLSGLVKTFLDLTYLMPLNQSNLKAFDMKTRAAKFSGSLSKGVLVDEIAEFLTTALNYSTALKTFAKKVASTATNSSKDVASLVENLLDFVAPINSMMRKLESKMILTQSLKPEDESNGIQKAASILLKIYSENNAEAKDFITAVSEFFSNVSWRNDISEMDLNELHSIVKKYGSISKALEIIVELFGLRSQFIIESLSMPSFLKRLPIQNAVELSILNLFHKIPALAGLPHFKETQKATFIRDLFQAILKPFLNVDGNRDDIVNTLLKIIHNFNLTFKMLSSYGKYSENLVFLVEQWLPDQRIYEMCQALHKHLNPEEALLLWKLQTAALNIMIAFADNPAFINNLQCAFKSCKPGLTNHFLLSVLEGVYLAHDQYQHAQLKSTKGDCENFVSLSKRLSRTLVEVQSALHNITDYSCECQHISESIHKNIQKLTETLEAPLSDNLLMAFLSNFSLPTDVKIKDCVQNTTELAQELHSVANISDKTIHIFMDSSISHPKFLSSALVAALAGSCDVEALNPLLTFSAEDKTPTAMKELCSLPSQELYTASVLVLKNLNLRNIIYKFKIPPEVDKLLNMLLDVVSSINSLLNKAENVFENLPTFLQTIKSTSLLDISSFQSIFQSGQPRSTVTASLQSVMKALCKEESSFLSNTNMFIEIPRVTELLEEDMAKFSIPEDSTQFCLQHYQEILQSRNGALIWTFLKPLLHGKILFTPNTEEINLVMQKANHIFDFIQNLKTYAEAWLQMTELVQNHETFFMVSQLQDALQNRFIKNFVESQLKVDVGELIGKINVYATILENMLNNSASGQITQMAHLMVNISSCLLLDRFQPVDSEEKLEVMAHELMRQNNFLASVIFNASTRKSDGKDVVNKLPKRISYTIRTSVLYSMRTDLIKNPKWKAHPQHLPADGFKYNHIFVPLQDMIERAIISVHTGIDTQDTGIQVQAMPYPCHTSDLFLNNVGFFFPLIMMLTWMVSVASMVRKLVYEREIRLEEYMKTMGVHPGVHFVAWFLENVFVLTLSSCALTVILKASSIFAYSDGFLVFLLFLDFGVSITMLSYLLSACFSTSNTAALCASLVYMISFLPYIIILVLQNQLTIVHQILVCFLSTTAFGQGVFSLMLFEGQEVGIQWSNMYQPLAAGGSMTFGWACWMILFDSILYFVAGWYFSNIIPGRFGVRLSWYFPFTLSYWKSVCGVGSKKQLYLDPALFFFNENFKDIEEPKKCSKKETSIGVMLMSLTKEYTGNRKLAVKDLSLTFYKDQITALLGPNGAGKTTVISMLTGLYPPSSGTILINGRDMETDLKAIQAEMGVCPQYDVLFDTLTVQEHLLLYGSVKCPLWTKGQLHQQVSRALMDAGLLQHQHKHIRALSGGMKRRLSITISFIGNSKIVVLDEPTSSIDPCSRRRIWDILLKYRAGRTLIFTTHHLDEAEVLSNRIAILQHGQLKCCGSPSYLKETYGEGHSLTFTKKPSVFAVEDPRDTFLITSLVQAYIPQAFLKGTRGSEVTFMIPTEADKASFKGLFQTLDENLQHLPVTGYGISDTTLEEVFLKLLQSTEKTSHISGVTTQPNSKDSAHENGDCLTEAQSIHGGRLILTQIAALLMKRLHHTRRDWRGTLSNILLPVVFVTIAMALFIIKPLAIDYPSLKLTPELYDNAESFFSAQNDDFPHLLLQYFADEDDPCLYSRRTTKDYLCWQTASSSQQQPLPWCECATTQTTCPRFNVSASYMKNRKGHTLFNLSGLNVEEYLIKLSHKARYGGWSFGGKPFTESQVMEVKKNPVATVWYDHRGFHSLPSYLNQLNNLILWKNLPPDVDWKQYGITLYNYPYGGALLKEDKIMENVRQCGVALCIVLGFSILTAAIGSSVVKDRVSGAKRLQHISGLSYKTYWLANFLFDMLLYLVPVSLCIGIITAFQLSAFTFRENLAATTLLLILFGYATIPWMYLMSRFFSSSDVAFISFIALNFISGLCTMLATLLPRLLAVISKREGFSSWIGKVPPSYSNSSANKGQITHYKGCVSLSFQNIYNILKWAFIVFPQFCLGQGLIELAYYQIKFDLASIFGIISYVTPFEMSFLGWIFTEMALQGTLLLILRLLLHWDLLQKPRNQRNSCSINSGLPPEDSDVEQERRRLFEGKTTNDILLLYSLRKNYQSFSKKNTVVKDISLGIQRGECFGLLGVNGAGKSTTFKMLSGDVTPSAGRAVIRTPTGSEMDIAFAGSKGIHIGYCPQQDALDDFLTGWEHLYYFCNLRGISKQHMHKVAGDLVSRLHLDAFADKLVRTYSGGTKRKLSTALALVGKPHILLLDEPSSGMDPCSKRYLWKTIMKEVQDGCAVVLTSHSMEECEALCTRLAIMVKGSFKCLGSPQHIKNRFGKGYSIKVWLHQGAFCKSAIMECLQFHFPGTLFKGQHLHLLEYHVPQRRGCLSELFKVLESNKTTLQIKHYSISQTTLEQVFLNFATQQQESSLSAPGSSDTSHCYLQV